MSAQLACRFCGGRHKAREDKLPLKLLGKKNEIIGYACRKCKRKYAKLKRKEGR